MYWYYKYPLILLATLAVIGLAYIGWKHRPAGLFNRALRRAASTQKAAARGQAPADSVPSQPSRETEAVRETVPPPAAPVSTSETPSEQATAGTAAVADSAALAIHRKRLETARAQLKYDRLLAARVLARKVLHSPDIPPFSELWMEAADIISRVNTMLINSDAPCPEKVDYVIKEGDTLSKIAQQFRTTVEAIQRSNNLDSTSSRIYPGDVLHIYTGDWHIVVKRSRCLLLLYDGDELFKLYRVGIGRQDRTPLGVFRIYNKIREPAWTPPGKVIPYGDPRNVLGTRWLGLEPIEGTNPALKGYGIHGTWEPDSIGKAVSQGCIRMRNSDVEELFDIVPVGTRVVIEEE